MKKYLTLTEIGEKAKTFDYVSKPFKSNMPSVTDKSMWKPTNNYTEARNALASEKAKMPTKEQFQFTEKEAENNDIKISTKKGLDPVEIQKEIEKAKDKINEKIKKDKENFIKGESQKN